MASAEPLLIGVTSHRNLVAEEIPLLREAVREFVLALRAQCPALELTVLSALAAGGDQLVAEEAFALGARVVAVLPMARAEYARDFADGVERATFEALCARATLIEMPVLDALDAGVADDPPTRVRQYAQAGVYIASHCHVLLALWDGRSNGRTGGTADVVAYHLDGIKPASLERRRDQVALNPFGVGSERVALHVVCSRDQPDGAPATPLRPLQVYWRSGDTVTAGLESIPDELHRTLARLADWNADVVRHDAAIATSARGVAHGVAATCTDSPIERRFAAADWLALHYQRRVLLAMRLLYTLAACMGIAFIVYDQLAQDSMIFAFLALFAIGVGIDALARRHAWHRKYLDYRALAEGLRVQAYWRRAGLAVSGDAEFAHDDFLQKQDVELDWIRNVMRSAAVEAATQPAPRVDLERAIEDWVGHDRGGGQLGYYARRSIERARRHRLTEGLGAASLWVGIGICVVLALTVLVLPKEWKTVLVAAMGAFSIIAAVREAYAYRKADKELIKQYRYMQRIFAQARRALDRADTPQHKRRVLRALGEAALVEHAEWTLMHRGRPLERARI
ncbi:MAG: hypothetical protein J0L88_13460 [Xanthomonadales bacterium]|nr:hypothetical protein [Xanthomonadales bacterium]